MKRLLLFASTILLAGCDMITGCTLIACVNGLVVDLQNAPSGALTVHARISEDSVVTATANCAGAAGCSTYFPQLTAPQVQLTLVTTAGTRVQTVTPTYTTSRPNGSGCDPTCRNGTVRIQWQN